MVNKKFVIPRGNAIRGAMVSYFLIFFVCAVIVYLIVSSTSVVQIVALFLLIAFSLVVIIHLNGGFKELTLRKDLIQIKSK